jgi:hypothetical protein
MQLTWSQKRKITIIAIIVAVVLGIGILFSYSLFSTPPTCFDTKKNQNELETDCGGVCSRLCSSQVRDPYVQFVRVLHPQEGRTDILAYIQNPNKDIQSTTGLFSLELYDASTKRIQTKEVQIPLAAESITPVLLPAVETGGKEIVKAFLIPKQESFFWTRITETKDSIPEAQDIRFIENPLPRVTATLVHKAGKKLVDTKFVAIIKDDTGAIIAASYTIVPLLELRSETTVVFTWNKSFGIPNPIIEILPVLKPVIY